MSLKANLNERIKHKGYLMRSEVYSIASELGYDQSTALRDLRPSSSPNIKTVLNDKGYITGYRWIGKELPETYSKKTLKLRELSRQQSLI